MFKDVFDEVCAFHEEQQGSVHWISMGDFQSAITKFPGKQVRNPLENLLDDRWKYPVTSTHSLVITYSLHTNLIDDKMQRYIRGKTRGR